MKCLKVLCPCDTYSRLVFIAVAPGQIVSVLNENNSRIVTVAELGYLLVVTFKFYFVILDVPVYAVL